MIARRKTTTTRPTEQERRLAPPVALRRFDEVPDRAIDRRRETSPRTGRDAGEPASDVGWPLVEPPESLDSVPLWNFYYLNSCAAPHDPTIVWGTDVDCRGLLSWLKRMNADSPVLITAAHLLVAATGRALAQHPQFNRRIMKGRIWRYRDVNVVMPFRSRARSALDVMFLANVDRKPVSQVAREAWRNADLVAGESNAVPRPAYMRFPRWLQRLLQPFHVWLVNHVNLPLYGSNNRQRAAATMVNYLGSRGLAPLRSFKPSRLPYDSVTLSVTMGAIERRPVVAGDEVVIRPLAPLFIRGDHRLADASEIGEFAGTLRRLLGDPAAWAGQSASAGTGTNVQRV